MSDFTKTVSNPVEFSKVYNLLNAVKKGEEEMNEEFEQKIEALQSPENCESQLHELGQRFLYVGIMELYKYTDSKDFAYIGNLEKCTWEELAERQNAELPQHLANSMIRYAKDNQLSEVISSRWNTSKRAIDKHVMRMSRYITEGLIDVLE